MYNPFLLLLAIWICHVGIVMGMAPAVAEEGQSLAKRKGQTDYCGENRYAVCCFGDIPLGTPYYIPGCEELRRPEDCTDSDNPGQIYCCRNFFPGNAKGDGGYICKPDPKRAPSDNKNPTPATDSGASQIQGVSSPVLGPAAGDASQGIVPGAEGVGQEVPGANPGFAQWAGDTTQWMWDGAGNLINGLGKLNIPGVPAGQ